MANMAQTKSTTKARVAKSSSGSALYRNKWLWIVGILVIAIAGIIALRASRAANPFSGRMPDDGSEPHIDYQLNINGSVTLKKSTNGETRTAANVDQAYEVGGVMYDEMIASQTPSTPAPPAPSTTPNTNSAPTTSNQTSTNSATTNTQPSSPSDPTTANTTSQSQGAAAQSTISTTTPASKKPFVLTLRRTVEIKPKLPIPATSVASVKFLLDGKLISAQLQSPYTFAFDTTKVTNGNHTLSTSVVNKDGSAGSTYTYSIKIDNDTSPLGKLLEILGW